MQNKMHTIWGISLMLVVMLVSSLSATASLMPLQMLSNNSVGHHQAASNCISEQQFASLQPNDKAMAHQVLSVSADCLVGQAPVSEQDCCAAAQVSCSASCAVHSAVLIPQIYTQIQPLEHILFIRKETRVQASSMARSVYRPPIV